MARNFLGMRTSVIKQISIPSGFVISHSFTSTNEAAFWPLQEYPRAGSENHLGYSFVAAGDRDRRAPCTDARSSKAGRYLLQSLQRIGGRPKHPRRRSVPEFPEYPSSTQDVQMPMIPEAEYLSGRRTSA